MVSFFNDRFKEDQYLRPKLEGVRFNSSFSEDNALLIAKFEESEVKVIVWECGNLKILGPDEFNFMFIKIKVFWNFLKEDVFHIVFLSVQM